MFKNIIFDWSGPVKDIPESHLWIINRMFKKMGAKEISSSEMRENWEEPYMNFWKKYFPDLIIEDELKMYAETIMDPECPEPKAYKGIIGLIKKLKDKGSSMSVLSFDSADTVIPEIRKFGLEYAFGDVITYVRDKGVALEELIERKKLELEKTIFIGDGNHEIETGKQAGIKTAAVTWGLCSEERLKAAQPDFLVHNVEELEKVLLK